ncbi:MAG: outer membrane protein assembly factor BamA [Candidatus Omnitrophica bacterium]|jgi:outer membrane protein insertion porin family|nr:outer membrane protein assembly factor BamA [Candidatus Omnitrophota bacterium]
MPKKYIAFYLAAIFFLFLIPAAFSQQAVEKETSAAAAKQEKLVTAIEIKGNKSISSNTIISKIKTRVGSAYQENVISDDLKRLYILGFFSDIKIDTQDYNDGIKLIINVVERPLIEKISFSGINRLTARDEKLKESLKSKQGQYLDYPNLGDDVKTLIKMYEKIGFSQVKINYDVSANPENGKVKIEFKVDEGKKVIIKGINIEGNKAYPAKRIKKLLKTKSAWLFNAGILKDEVLKEDVERVKSFYAREGYTDADVLSQVRADGKKNNWLYVNIIITEGKRYYVGNVVIEGNNDVSLKDILAQIKACSSGKVFSHEAVKDDSASIRSLYFDKGYISADITSSASLNADTNRVDISYKITENQIAYVDKIMVTGNVKTKDIVVRRELRIHPADKFDGEKLRRSKERLQNLGFFEEVSYDTKDTSVPDKKDLIVDVKESKTGSFSFGGGYSTVEQFIGFVEIEQKNFDWRNFPYFTGAGQDLRLRASLGNLSSGFDLSFTEPWMFDYPVSFGFDAYKRSHKREQNVGYGYDEDVTGGDLRLGKEISEYVKADLMYRYDQIDISNISDDATNDLRKEIGKNTISSVQFGMSFDSRDNVFSPVKGDLLTGSMEVAGGPLGASKDFTKFFGRASHFVPLWRNSSLEFRGRLGLASPYGNSDEIPIYERFFAGGATTVRGYDERKVGPIDPVSKDPLGGEALLIGNIEYLYPLYDFLKLAAFYDVGNVWAKQNDLGKGGFKTGIGLGVRVKTPIGPLMLDYGIPLNKEPGEDTKSGKFHFNISHGF